MISDQIEFVVFKSFPLHKKEFRLYLGYKHLHASHALPRTFVPLTELTSLTKVVHAAAAQQETADSQALTVSTRAC